jgi:hypothetical protein
MLLDTRSDANLSGLKGRSRNGYTSMVDSCGYGISLQNIMDHSSIMLSGREPEKPRSMLPLDRKPPNYISRI